MANGSEKKKKNKSRVFVTRRYRELCTEMVNQIEQRENLADEIRAREWRAGERKLNTSLINNHII